MTVVSTSAAAATAVRDGRTRIKDLLWASAAASGTACIGAAWGAESYRNAGEDDSARSFSASWPVPLMGRTTESSPPPRGTPDGPRIG
ncbi:hypothetical protein GCM10011579_097380 [Streptomyces albiflavescens]|uniref:Uncharacterized protein n=1 Tax=Streptomyces albiflavescens TaxID=1623582 RepID=A0A917YF66_9ACTN|nr:hypothetical protein GCM10011579_097380 [Streptomyces albiflavescens]